ncbi:MAG: L-rhamnose isomerase [Clostridia bacterium]|nr:L-rhamnose isomerase [Clostridia bacterium]
MGTYENYLAAKQIYEAMGVDVEKALETLKNTRVSMHCWQGDDVSGFESEGPLTGGIQVTGDYPGKARNLKELQEDIRVAASLIPGKHKINLHAIYGDFSDGLVDRDAIEPKHFKVWVDMAKEMGWGLDFNPTFFSHPKSNDGTLSSADEETRKFWVNHGIACRKITEYFGKETGIVSVMNTWIPDGSKEVPVDMIGPRQRFKKSLDEMYAVQLDDTCMKDAIESKLFGIGAESYTVGSNEFCTAYAAQNNKVACFDIGHYHPTEVVYDKLPTMACFVDEALLHLSRPVRWDSDHVTNMNDDVLGVMHALVRNDLLDKTYIALDYFDGTINRVAAWVVGMRAAIKSLLFALLEPVETMRKAEEEGDYTTRLALREECKSLPFGAIWDYYCETSGVPVREQWIAIAKEYEKKCLAERA